ncbi:SH3 domain-containing protein [Fusarium circinatum]|uniref:SH3 domain-containing protein n=1 Tax=Fusarium circinatum TaxID=48490 RepID=A0A8H5T9J1_FUSCI|nr:SH3 domain-containing protein [Fusarium circinatum]
MSAARKKKLSISGITGSNKKENMKGNGGSNGTGGGWSFGRWGSTKTASTNTTSSSFSQSKPKPKSKSKFKSVPEHKHKHHKHPPRPARTLLSIPPSSTRQFGFGAVSFSSSLSFPLPFSRFSCRRLQFGPQETPRHCSSSLRLQFRLLCLLLLDYSIIYTNIIIRLAHHHRNNNPGLVSCLVCRIPNSKIDINIRYSRICTDQTPKEIRPLPLWHDNHL